VRGEAVADLPSGELPPALLRSHPAACVAAEEIVAP
jgi:hypothetical protein